MKDIYIKRFNKIIKFLERLPDNEFYFGYEVSRHNNRCGSICCVVGWFPKIFPRSFCWHLVDGSFINAYIVTQSKKKNCKNYGWYDNSVFWEKHGPAYLGIACEEFSNLFNVGTQHKLGLVNLGANATPKQAAATVKEYLKIKLAEN